MLYNVVFISAVQQSESAICIHIPPSWTSFSPTPHPSPSRSSQSPELSSLCYIQQIPKQLSVCTWWYIYVSSALANHPTLSFPNLCPRVHFVYLPLYSCPANRLLSTVILEFHVYVLIYKICFSLSDFTLYGRL